MLTSRTRFVCFKDFSESRILNGTNLEHPKSPNLGISIQPSLGDSRICDLRCLIKFEKFLTQFREPYLGKNNSEVTQVKESNFNAYFLGSLDTTLLLTQQHGDDGQSRGGIYIEVEVLRNADILSLALVDLTNAGGKRSVMFSPDTGAVVKETKQN